MEYKIETFNAVEKKLQRDFIELTENLWHYINNSSFCAIYINDIENRIVAISDKNGKHFWVNTVSVHHDDYETTSGLIGVNIGDFIELTETGLVLWSKELFNEKFKKVDIK